MHSLPKAFFVTTEEGKQPFFAYQTYERPGVSIVYMAKGQEASQVFYAISLVELAVFGGTGKSWNDVIDLAIEHFAKSRWVSILVNATDPPECKYEDILELF